MAKPSEKDLLVTAKARFKQGEDAYEKQTLRELEDIQVYNGDQWPEDVLRTRQGLPANGGMPAVPARPALVINKLRQPVRQVLNQALASDIGVELVPADDFAALEQPPDPLEIELREGLVRRIQRTSEAMDARMWALDRAVIAGRGFYGVTTRYVDGKTFDQEIVYRRFYNQASVMLDPAHELPDGSDAEWGFIGTDMPWDQYVSEFGEVAGKKNMVCGTSVAEFRALGDEAPGWFNYDDTKETRTCRVVEYLYTVRETRTLCLLANGSIAWQDELPEGATVKDRRDVTEKQVKWAKIDGCQLLDETDWPSPFIGIIKVLGEELQPDQKHGQRSEGLVRTATGSQRAFNYIVSKFVEVVGLSKIPDTYIAAGQDEGFEQEWQLSTTRTLPVIHYNNRDVNGDPVGEPKSIQRSSDSQNLAMGIQIFGEAVKDTTATPDPTLGNIDPSLKSGKAIAKLVEQSQKGNSHFIDNWRRSISYDGKIVNSLLYPIYGRPGRIARIVTGTGDEQTVMLHTPMVSTEKGPVKFDPTQHTSDQQKTYTLTPDANFNVVVKVTKSFDTRREQEASFFADLISSNPEMMAVYGDLMFENMDGPGHQEAAERAKAMLAPPVQQLLSGKTPPDPKILAQMQQAQKVIDELTAHVNELTQQIQSKQIENETKKQIAMGQAAVELEKAKIEAQKALAVAEISAKSKADVAEMTKRVDILEAMIGVAKESRLEAHASAHEKASTAMEHGHALVTQALEHQHEQDLAEQTHQHNKEITAMTPDQSGNGVG